MEPEPEPEPEPAVAGATAAEAVTKCEWCLEVRKDERWEEKANTGVCSSAGVCGQANGAADGGARVMGRRSAES